jgi:hypothetical protein
MKTTERDLNYGLGILAGELVVQQLPTLSVDSLQSYNVIKVTTEDFTKHSKLEKIWYNSAKEYKDYTKENPNWVAFRKFQEELEAKYLDDEITIRIPQFPKPTDMAAFKEAMDDAIWDCDYSNYRFERLEFSGGWCVKVKLNRIKE